MNIQFRTGVQQDQLAETKTAIADCDIHPARATRTELYPYLASPGTAISRPTTSISTRA
jgi:hypothetical protein